MKKIITLQVVFLITTSVFASNSKYDTLPVLAKRASPKIDVAPQRDNPKTYMHHCLSSVISTPLVVVDGKMFEYNKIPKINPDDIEVIYILKGSYAVAIYGEIAKDGAILIKTKVDSLSEFPAEEKKDSSKINHMNIILNKSSFKVYPNPVQAGTSINIEWKQPEEGEYILQLFNQAGQMTFNKAMWIDNEARVLSLELPHIAAGSYFLRMTNKDSGKSFTEKMIIQ